MHSGARLIIARRLHVQGLGLRKRYGKVGFSLFFCDFQEENAEIAPFFVHVTKK